MSLLLLLAGCANEPTYYSDVKPILDARCANCHLEGGIGPFALDSYQAASLVPDAIAASVEARTMPPWGADSSARSYLEDPSLSDEQIATIADWVAAGAPEGDPADEGAPLDVLGGTLSRVDTTLALPVPYDPVGQPDDDYRCFVVEWPFSDLRYVTGFNVLPDNKQVVHHVAAYLFSADNIMGEGLFDTLQEWEDHDPEPGYPCFGGPSGPTGDLQVPVQQLAQWVPGMASLPFPEGTGIGVLPGSKVVLQVHYYDPNGDPNPDQSAIEFMVESEVDRLAAFAPWLDGVWPLGNMHIPAGNDDVRYSINRDPRAFFELFIDEDLDMEPGFEIHSLLLHMHTRATAGTVELHKADGSVETLVHSPNYDFNWQFIYRFETASQFEPGDSLRLECQWDNSDGNQPDGQPAVDLNWGEGTEDEMCVANLFISEL